MSLLKKIRLSLNNCRVNFMAFHQIALAFSVISIVISIALVLTKGLNYGIDFAGGVLIEARIEDKFEISQLRQKLSSQIEDIHIQESGTHDILIRVSKTNGEQSQIIKKIQDTLNQNYQQIEYRKIDFVGPQVGSELIMKGSLALFLSFLFIMIYIWIRFDWQFGIGGIFALIHDAILTLGFFAITGLEFNLTSIASILTIIGYSINDSVVIYDRIRENLKLNPKIDLINLINSSTNSTLSRTILTASTTLISLLALILFGGEALFSFSMATFFGIAIGTYSSIYISAPILLYFDPRNKDKKKAENRK
ncbi:MAG: protein translocase subunit SecF [Alphaproteobacteria bacterium]|nr:protein translocase subunit SecF [Alphaproteobacteria bacterium]